LEHQPQSLLTDLVRHYDLRSGSNMADIQVNLLHKGDRELQSHDIAKDVRPQVQKIAKNMAQM
jgi:hypothetical protein